MLYFSKSLIIIITIVTDNTEMVFNMYQSQFYMIPHLLIHMGLSRHV